jgi:superfamily II DNA or RNA helicase
MGIITSPTGSGKTVMLAILLDELRLKSLVLVTDLVLLDQMQLALSKYFNTDIGIIGDGEFDLKDITVSTVQSILSMYKSGSSSALYKKAKFLDWIDSVGVVVSDEAHLYDSDGVAQIMPLFKQSSRFYGLSATPYGWSGKSEQRSNLELEQHFGEIIYDTRKLDFISLGLRVPLVVDVVNNTPVNIKYRNHMKRIRGKLVPDHGKNYAECLSTEILTRGEYHQMVADKVAELNSLGMTVFVHAAHTIAFGDAITKLISGAEFVSGSTPRQRRREIYQAMRDGQLQTIVSDVGGTGLDIPSLGAIVLASDLQDVRQIIGRVIRKSQNKDYGMVVDFRTDCDYLSKHADTRRYQYEYENAIITNS